MCGRSGAIVACSPAAVNRISRAADDTVGPQHLEAITRLAMLVAPLTAALGLPEGSASITEEATEELDPAAPARRVAVERKSAPAKAGALLVWRIDLA
jgi:hypothetical protein